MSVGGIVALGLVARALYVLVVLDDVAPGADAVWYQLQGGGIREGKGFVVPRTLFTGELLSTAAFPPLYPAFLGAWHVVVGASPSTDAVRLAGLVPAAATIVLTALLGRRVAGERVGVVAALLVALHPGLVAVDGSAMSENLTVPLVVGAQVLALRLVDATGRRAQVARAAALGGVLGLAVLTRQDLVVLALLLAGWLVVALPGDVRAAVPVAGLVGVTALAVVAPWLWRNHQAVDVVAVSTLSPTSALAGANCDATYAGASVGSWDYGCVVAARPGAASEDELLERRVPEGELMDAYQQAALDHARRNLTQLPTVVAARQARVWSLWSPTDLARRDADESRRYGWQLVARPLEAVLGLVGAAGLALRIRRRSPATFVLVVPVLTVACSAAVGYGNPRFNAIAQPSLLVAAAWLALVVVAPRWPQDQPAPAATP
jgi:hypothetical protein